MNLLKSKKLILAIFCSSLAVSFDMLAQKVTPESLEQWEPVPKVVTPGEGTKPPSDAIVLFDGKSLSNWESEKGGEAKWQVKDGAMTVVKGASGVKTKQQFGDIQLHIEWRSPAKVEGEGQGRGNSGIFLQGLYELQVLDSYNSKTYVNGQAGSIYKDVAPLANATKKPGEWQVYDVVYIAPKFKADGTLESPARFTVFHNGVLIHHDVSIKGRTFYDQVHSYEAHGKGPISLQDHGNPVSYRNIWVREL